MPAETMIDIALRFLQRQETAGELQQLAAWVNQTDSDEEIYETLAAAYASLEVTQEGDTLEPLSRIQANLQQHMQAPLITMKPRRTIWKRIAVAAAAIAVLITGVYLWNLQQKEKPAVAQTNPLPLKNDVLPGGNRAVLTLAGGQQLILDNATNGQLATQGETRVTKKGNEIIYDVSRLTSHDSRLRSPDLSPAGGGGPGGAGGGPTLFNTMTTPRGGQYQLTLPDGSQVWLNAESSITYPVLFTGNTREVSMTGEAYFEVKKDKTKPFRIKISPAGRGGASGASAGGKQEGERWVGSGDYEVEVLGTHFNINAYANEPDAVTTLLEGSVRIRNKILRPGEAYANGNVYAANTAQAVAWKNGLFNFDNADLPAVMRQLSRWYDVDVEYEGSIRPRKFAGKIQRDLKLSDLLEGLRRTDVHFRIEGKKLIVTK